MASLWQWWRDLTRQEKFDPSAFPAWYRVYYQGAVPWPGSTPVSELEFVVFDTETTGLDPREDRIVSIGAIKVHNNRIQTNSAFSCFLNPNLAATKTDAIVIHGLVPDSGFREYHREEKAIPDFLGWLGPRSILVAHHLGFDRRMIDDGLQRLGAGKLLNQGIDTVRLAQKIQPSGYWMPDENFSLDLLAKQYKIPLSDRHTALGDSYITAVLLVKLLHRLENRKGRPLLLEDITGK